MHAQRYDLANVTVHCLAGPSALVALARLALLYLFLFANLTAVTPLNVLLTLASTLGYSALGYYVRPKPHITC